MFVIQKRRLALGLPAFLYQLAVLHQLGLLLYNKFIMVG